MKKIILLLIKFYQKALSPDQGFFSFGARPTCRFFPTCSSYAYEAVEKYGVFKGLTKGFFRILKCHPWHQGGIDYV